MRRDKALHTANNSFERWSELHYENFTVGSPFLPLRLRTPVRVLYAYCRYVDNLGDEAPGDRLALLNEWETDFLRCYDGNPKHPILRALQLVIHTFNLPPEPFLKLIEANRMDQRYNRYPTYEHLLRYCEHSANPVGHLFLALLGYNDTELLKFSDATCTALQLVNFLQDVALDYQNKGRIYLPLEDMAHFGVTEQMIAKGQATTAFRSLLAFQAGRARSLLMAGLPLADHIHGRARIDVRLFSLGGLAVLDGLAAIHYDVFKQRPIVTKRQKIQLLLRALVWSIRSRPQKERMAYL